MESRSAVLGFILNAIGNTEKSEILKAIGITEKPNIKMG